MHQIEIDASPSQIKRLTKGHKVRVKKGKGLCLIVHPETYNIASRAFNKGKGAQLQLTQEEIRANLAPKADEDVREDEYDIDDEDEIRGSGLKDVFSHLRLSDKLNKHLGTNYGYLKRAGLDNAIQGAKSAAMNKMGIDARMLQAPRISGMGTHALQPPSRIVGGQLERSSVGRNGGMISMYTPPALVSQPFSANFQFQHFLPPQYQHFNSGGSTDFGGSGFH